MAGISDKVVFKHANLDQRLQYDAYPRKSLLDHFYEPGTSLESVARGEAAELGDFLHRPYEARVRRNPERIQVLLTRQGNAWGQPLKITKGVTSGSVVSNSVDGTVKQLYRMNTKAVDDAFKGIKPPVRSVRRVR